MIVSRRDRYSPEPADKKAFTERFDRLYGRSASIYDLAIRFLPRRRNPQIQDPTEVARLVIPDRRFRHKEMVAQLVNQCALVGLPRSGFVRAAFA